MRHDFHSRWELGSLNVYAWLGRVPVQDCVLRSRANRRFELYLIRKFNDGLGALRVSSHRNSYDEQHDPKVRNAHYFLPYRRSKLEDSTVDLAHPRAAMPQREVAMA